jgi:hypothetical protein
MGPPSTTVVIRYYQPSTILTPDSGSRPIYLLDVMVTVEFHPRRTGPYLTRTVDCYKKYMTLVDKEAN